MKALWIAGLALAATSTAIAQTTIYKHIDDGGRVTYSNKPMKGAVVVELEPLTTIPATPRGVLGSAPSVPPPVIERIETRPEPSTGTKPAVAIVTPIPSPVSFPSVDSSTQKRRDEGRRRILEQEMEHEEQMLAEAQKALGAERQNPSLIQAVRVAQQTVDPTPQQQTEFRRNIQQASERIRALQSTIAEHEKNIEALKKELGALKP